MREVRLGSEFYFVREESDPIVETALAAFPDGSIVKGSPLDVWQIVRGHIVQVTDPHIIEMAKAKAAIEAAKEKVETRPSSPKKPGPPEWESDFRDWLDKEHEANRLPLEGSHWVVRRTKTSVWDDLSLKIALSTFKERTKPQNFLYKPKNFLGPKFPLKWDISGG